MRVSVDHRKLKETASAIDSYVTKHRNNMTKIVNTVENLSSSWQGVDYTQMQTECQQLNASDSTSELMLKSLENYADYLQFASKKYMDAQSNAVNRANRLPTY